MDAVAPFDTYATYKINAAVCHSYLAKNRTAELAGEENQLNKNATDADNHHPE